MPPCHHAKIFLLHITSSCFLKYFVLVIVYTFVFSNSYASTSVEFGLLREGSSIKAYGAGVLSSFGEMEHAMGTHTEGGGGGGGAGGSPPIMLPWDPYVASTTAFPITTYQPKYFVAESLADAKQRMRSYTQQMPRPFYARYNALTHSVWVDRAIRVNRSHQGK